MMRKALTIIGQVALFYLVSLAGTWLTAALHLPVPGSMVGMGMMFALLRLKVIKLAWVEGGANWLLAYLLLFFVPAAVGIVQYRQMLMVDGSRVMLVIVVSTLAVMACTGLLAEFVTRRKGAGAQ